MDGLTLATILSVNAKSVLSKWDYPILLIRSKKGTQVRQQNAFDTPHPALSTFDTAQSETDENSFEYYLDPKTLVLPLCKSQRNSFSQMLTIGRAQNNDICLTDVTLSKVHGWFLPPDVKTPSWRYTDNTSTNGTYINRIKIQAQRPINLNFGDEIILGQIAVLFVSKDNIYDLMEYMQKENEKTTKRLVPRN